MADFLASSSPKLFLSLSESRLSRPCSWRSRGSFLRIWFTPSFIMSRLSTHTPEFSIPGIDPRSFSYLAIVTRRSSSHEFLTAKRKVLANVVRSPFENAVGVKFCNSSGLFVLPNKYTPDSPIQRSNLCSLWRPACIVWSEPRFSSPDNWMPRLSRATRSGLFTRFCSINTSSVLGITSSSWSSPV